MFIVFVFVFIFSLVPSMPLPVFLLALTHHALVFIHLPRRVGIIHPSSSSFLLLVCELQSREERETESASEWERSSLAQT